MKNPANALLVARALQVVIHARNGGEFPTTEQELAEELYERIVRRLARDFDLEPTTS